MILSGVLTRRLVVWGCCIGLGYFCPERLCYHEGFCRLFSVVLCSRDLLRVGWGGGYCLSNIFLSVHTVYEDKFYFLEYDVDHQERLRVSYRNGGLQRHTQRTRRRTLKMTAVIGNIYYILYKIISKFLVTETITYINTYVTISPKPLILFKISYTVMVYMGKV